MTFPRLAAVLLSVASAAIAAADAIIQVRVSDETGAPLRGAYVAVVAEGEPWRAPLREAIAPEAAISWNGVPEGTYRILVAAPGYFWNFSKPVDVTAAAVPIVVALTPLTTITGRIVDGAGAPIAGARIGVAKAFTRGGEYQLSAIAEDYLRDNFSSKTADDGRFTLRAHPTAAHLLWIEAPGFAPTARANVKAQQTPDLGDIALQRGASFTARLIEERADDRLQLFPLEIEEVGAGRTLLLDVWTRLAAGPEQRWDALPAGRYELWLRAPQSGAHDRPPVVLTSFRVGPGDRHSATVAFPPPEAPPVASEKPLRLLVRRPRAELKGISVTRWLDGRGEEVPYQLGSASGGSVFRIAGGCTDGASYVLQSKQFIGTSRVTRETCDGTPLVDLHPAAELSAIFRAPARMKLPASGVVRARACRTKSSERADRGTFTFALASDGRANILVPAGCNVLTFAIGDFAVVSGEPVDVAAGARRDLGLHVLRPAGSLLARVVSDVDGRAEAGVTVALFAASDLQAVTFSQVDNQRRIATGTTDRLGWVRLYGIPPGTFVVQLTHPRHGYAQFSEPYAIRAGQELILDRLELHAPSTIEVSVTVDQEMLDAGLSLSGVHLLPGADNPWPRRAARLAPLTNNRALLEGIPPGAWSLAVTGRVGNSAGGTALATRPVVVRSGDSLYVEVPIESLLYRGKVELRGQPVIGELKLRRAAAARGEAQLALAKTDDQGRFQVLLATPGKFHIEIRNDLEARSHVVRDVEFTSADREVVVRLPEGRITGRVVDGEGNGVAEVEVRAVTGVADKRAGESDIEQHVVSGRDGTFVFDSVAPGVTALDGRLNERTTARVVLELVEDQQVGDVKLLLAPARELRGRITFAGGAPVPNQPVFAELAPSIPGDSGWTGSTTARADGTFRLRLPNGTESLSIQLFLTRRDGTWDVYRRRLSDAELQLVVPVAYGALRIRRDRGSWDTSVPRVLVAADGAYVNVADVSTTESSGEGKRADVLVIGRIAPGVWRLVEIRSAADMHTVRTGEGLRLVATGTINVAPQGMTEIVIDEKEK
ncbi:MAG TPA: carboxypeptidase regulatory-like domain-containing protein [Thermoanaerobaculia bacterium]|jgi:hypothetical protein